MEFGRKRGRQDGVWNGAPKRAKEAHLDAHLVKDVTSCTMYPVAIVQLVS